MSQWTRERRAQLRGWAREVCCPSCHAHPDRPCRSLRPPYGVCAPHKERLTEAESYLEKRAKAEVAA